MASRSAAVVLCALLVSSTALAAPTAAQRETARRLMDEGKERTKSGDLQRALDAYAKAHEIMHVPTTGLAVARAHLALGHLVEARDMALEVVRLPRESNEPAVFDDARKRARDLDASLRPRIPTVRILVKGGPATRVAVDDGEVAQLLLGEPVALNPGRHVVSAKNADGVEQTANVDLAERESKQVELTLPAPKPVTVAAPAEPDARPAKSSDDRPKDGGGGARDVLVYGGFGLAAVGLVVGTVTGVIVLSKAGDVKPQCANNVCDPSAQSDLDGAKSLATVSTIAFIAAGAFAAVGGIGLALPRSRGSSSALQWNVGPGGVAVRGTF